MKSYNYSYNVLINRLEAFAAGHFLIRRFTHGQIDMSDQLQDDQYPFMHVTPDTIEPVPGAMNFGFHIMFADIPRDKDYKAEYQREVISDCIRLGQDLIAEVKNGLELFGFDVQLLETPTFEPFMEEQKNTVTGVAFTLKLSVPWDWSACDIPAIWSVGGASGTGGEGTGYGITLRTNGVDNVVQTLLNLVEGTNITITDNGNGSVTIDSEGGIADYVSTAYNANHTTATGNQYVVGDRVWYSGNVYQCIANNDAIIPTNTLYWTVIGAGYRLRQTPVDWNASTGDFQILNKPTIPAAQVNSDWNAASGVAQILNKPTIPTAQVNSDWTAASGVSQILNKPTLATVATTGSYTDLINQPSIPPAQVNSDWNSVSGISQILNKPTIPAAQVNSDWNSVSGVSEIFNKPTIPAAQVNSDWSASSGIAQILNKPTIPAAQVNSDWNAVSGLAEILNKPTIPTTLDSLTDVNTPAPTNGQVLTYNTTTGQWIASTPTSGSGTVQSVALSMPAPANPAFSVAGSPVTNTGTLAVSANGTVDQYIDGTGALRTMPSTGGGGSSVSYYLNGSINQGTIGGSAYYQMSKTAVFGAGTDFTRTNAQGNGLIAQFITDANDPNVLLVPGGNFNLELYFNASSSGGTPSFYVELYKYDGATFTLLATDVATPEGITQGTVIDAYFTALAVPPTTMALTDRLAMRVFVTTSGRTLKLHTENSHLSQVITTLSTGVNALNGLTAQVQNFAVGTAGANFGISSVGSTHTFNLPTASAANRGLLSTTDWLAFNGKQNNIGLTTVGNALATLADPNAITFPRINADNSVTARTPAQVLSDLGVAATIIIARDFGTYTLSSSTINTLVWSAAIAANTFQTNDLIEWFSQMNTNALNGVRVDYRLYINTSASLVGAQLLATFTNTVGTGCTMLSRHIFVTASGVSGNLRVFGSGSNSSTSSGITAGIASNVTVNTTITQHLIVAIQHQTTAPTSSVVSTLIRTTR